MDVGEQKAKTLHRWDHSSETGPIYAGMQGKDLADLTAPCKHHERNAYIYVSISEGGGG